MSPPPSSSRPPSTFLPSQLASALRTTPLPYTSPPLQLLRADVLTALRYLPLAPYIVFPLPRAGRSSASSPSTSPSPSSSSGALCELAPTWPNAWACVLHALLVLLQAAFLVSVPFWLLLPVWAVGLGGTVWWAAFKTVWRLLNGENVEFRSRDGLIRECEAHRGERWLFMNGVAVGEHWMQSALDRLAITFGRPVIGIHNKTNGIIFDVLQALIQRNFTIATNDVRSGYTVLKRYLYDSKVTKVVFILHSQGGIEGGLIVDWLLQEVPRDLLAKIEVYTFGCAANHFNNPRIEPAAAITSDDSGTPCQTSTARDAKTIRYIEHYAHTEDFVARWGVLHYLHHDRATHINENEEKPGKSAPVKPGLAPKYMGCVFERNAKGHQMVGHYLDGMFPLKRRDRTKNAAGITASMSSAEQSTSSNILHDEFEGADEENAFMDEVIEYANTGSRSCVGAGPWDTGTQDLATTDEDDGSVEHEEPEVHFSDSSSQSSESSSIDGAHDAPVAGQQKSSAVTTRDSNGHGDSDEDEDENDAANTGRVIIREMTTSSRSLEAAGISVLTHKALRPRPTETTRPMRTTDRDIRVKHLSRLWQYRNGRVPCERARREAGM